MKAGLPIPLHFGEWNGRHGHEKIWLPIARNVQGSDVVVTGF